jgi:hypothetical protein
VTFSALVTLTTNDIGLTATLTISLITLVNRLAWSTN